jgi:hypothetical protein
LALEAWMKTATPGEKMDMTGCLSNRFSAFVENFQIFRVGV